MTVVKEAETCGFDNITRCTRAQPAVSALGRLRRSMTLLFYGELNRKGLAPRVTAPAVASAGDRSFDEEKRKRKSKRKLKNKGRRSKTRGTVSGEVAIRASLNRA